MILARLSVVGVHITERVSKQVSSRSTLLSILYSVCMYTYLHFVKMHKETFLNTIK